MYKLIKIDNYWIIVEFKKNFNINPNTLYLKKYPERITLSQYNGYGDWDIILYSTNPEHNLPSISFSDEVAKELGIIDVEKLAKTNTVTWHETESSSKFGESCYVAGYNQALFDNKDKLFTLEQIKLFAMEIIAKYKIGTLIDVNQVNEIIQSLTKQEYEVELEMTNDIRQTNSLYPQPKLISNSVKVIKIIK